MQPLGGLHQKRAEYDLAEFHLQKAIALNPNDADTICYMGIYLAYAGQASRAIEWRKCYAPQSVPTFATKLLALRFA